MIRNMILSLSLVSTILLMAGCSMVGKSTTSPDTKLVIPDYPTAKEQYEFAVVYQNGQVVSPDAVKRKEQMSKVALCYEKVITNFPEDQSYVASSMLELGDCYVQSSKHDHAIRQYRKTMERFPADEYIQARALFAIGRTLEMQNKFTEAKAVYKEVMDRFGQNTAGNVKDVVRRASKLYYQVRDPAKLKSKKKKKDD